MTDEPPFEVDAGALQQFNDTAALLVSQGINLYKLPILRTLNMLSREIVYDPAPGPVIMAGVFCKATICKYLTWPRGSAHTLAWDAAVQALLDEALINERYNFDTRKHHYGLTAKGVAYCESELLAHT